jgi:hypothetical protein
MRHLTLSPRRQGTGRRYLGCAKYVRLGEKAISLPDYMIEVMQDILNKLNESQRELFVLSTSLIEKFETVS